VPPPGKLVEAHELVLAGEGCVYFFMGACDIVCALCVDSPCQLYANRVIPPMAWMDTHLAVCLLALLCSKASAEFAAG
jgi:hypothetical protein